MSRLNGWASLNLNTYAGSRCCAMHLRKQVAYLLADDIVTLFIQLIAVIRNTKQSGHKIHSVYSRNMDRNCARSLPGYAAW